MRMLVTAGNTQAPIDQVRCITNIFSGRTGTRIALLARQRGHSVTLLTSHPEVVDEFGPPAELLAKHWHVGRYRTFDDLHERLAESVAGGQFDAIVHTAAVSDYLTGGVYAPAAGTRFDSERWAWSGVPEPLLENRLAGKTKSDDPELWLRLVKAPKLINLIRSEWKFPGVLVKFKLEVGISDAELQTVAERSRKQSDADLIVANTLEGAANWAIIGPISGLYAKIPRRELAPCLLAEVERLHSEGRHG